MLESQLIEEFRLRIVGDTEREMKERDDPAQLAADIALTEVLLADLEEAGVITEHDLCPFQDEAGRGRCKLIAYSLPDGGSRLELITSSFVELSDGGYLSNQDVAKLAGQAARFFGYAVRGEHNRFLEQDTALDAAIRINDEMSRIEEVRIHILTNAVVRDRNVEDIQVDLT